MQTETWHGVEKQHKYGADLSWHTGYIRQASRLYAETVSDSDGQKLTKKLPTKSLTFLVRPIV